MQQCTSDNLTGTDYEIYFEDSNHPGPYGMQAVMNDGGNAYSSCGNAFNLVGQEKADQDIEVEVWGITPNGNNEITSVEAWLDSSLDVVTADIISIGGKEEYHLFSVPDDGSIAEIKFYDAGSNLILIRTKDMRSASDVTIPLHVARVNGTLEANFAAASAANRIEVYDEYPIAAQNILSSDDNIFPTPYLFEASGDEYAVFFEVTPNTETQGVVSDGEVQIRFEDDSGYYSWRTEVDKNPASPLSVAEKLTGGEDIVISLANSMNGAVHSDVKEIKLVDGSGWNPIIAETDGSTPSTYIMYFDSLTVSSGNWIYNSHTNPVVLGRNQGVTASSSLNGDVFNVGKLSGDTHSDLYNGTIEVWDNFDTNSNILSSAIVRPDGSILLFRSCRH